MEQKEMDLSTAQTAKNCFQMATEIWQTHKWGPVTQTIISTTITSSITTTIIFISSNRSSNIIPSILIILTATIMACLQQKWCMTCPPGMFPGKNIIMRESRCKIFELHQWSPIPNRVREVVQMEVELHPLVAHHLQATEMWVSIPTYWTITDTTQWCCLPIRCPLRQVGVVPRSLTTHAWLWCINSIRPISCSRHSSNISWHPNWGHPLSNALERFHCPTTTLIIPDRSLVTIRMPILSLICTCHQWSIITIIILIRFKLVLGTSRYLGGPVRAGQSQEKRPVHTWFGLIESPSTMALVLVPQWMDLLVSPSTRLPVLPMGAITMGLFVPLFPLPLHFTPLSRRCKSVRLRRKFNKHEWPRICPSQRQISWIWIVLNPRVVLHSNNTELPMEVPKWQIPVRRPL